MSRRPGARPSPRPGPRAAGSAAPSSAGSCRRRRRRRPCRCSGTMRSNHTRKNVDSGGRCGVVISSTTTRPPGRTTRAISRQPAVEVGEVARAEADGRGVERAVGVGQVERVAPLEAQRRAPCAARASSISSEKSEPTTSPPGPTRRASSTREVAGAASRRRARGRPARPPPGRRRGARQRWCRPAVMTEFMTVVERRDAVEHRPDLRLLEGAGRGRGRRPPAATSPLSCAEERDQRVELLGWSAAGP